ncbi:MAG: TolC family protein [Acidobacteriota bacterium]
MTSFFASACCRKPLGALLLALLVLWALPASAQQSAFDTSWLAEEKDADLEGDEDGIKLSLDEAVTLSLSNNLGLRVERFRRAQDLFRIQQQEGIYDFNLAFNAGLDESTTAAVTVLAGADVAEAENQFFNLQLRQLVSTGGTFGIDYNNRRSESNSQFQLLNPSFNLNFDAVYTQPLLRDAGRLATERGIRVAQTNARIGLENLKTSIVNTVQQVENAYWTLVAAREQLAVDQQSLGLAEQLHEMNKVQVRVGTKAPLELIQSEVGIATRQEAIILSQAAVEDAEDDLKQLLNLPVETLWERSIVPVTEAEIDRLSIDLDGAIGTSLNQRPELVAQRNTLKNLELDSKFFAQQKKPTLNLEARYGYSGIGGDTLVLAPGSSPFDPNPDGMILPGGYGDALEQITDLEFDAWSIGFNFNFPLQNRAAKAASTIADLALAQGETELANLILQVRTEVRRAARLVLTGAEQIDSAKKSRELAERNLEAEQKRYENGLSTSFQVLEIQEDLSLAQTRVVNAVTGYRRAIVDFFRSIGTLLPESGIEIDDIEDRNALKP